MTVNQGFCVGLYINSVNMLIALVPIIMWIYNRIIFIYLPVVLVG